MSKKDKHPIEKRITDSLRTSQLSPNPQIQQHLRQALRAQQPSLWQKTIHYKLPLWQVAAAFLLLAGAQTFFFSNPPTTEKPIVRTEKEPYYFFQTDTIVQIQEIEKIVYKEIPVPMVAAPPQTPKIATITPAPPAIKPTQSVPSQSYAQATPMQDSPPQRGRSIQEDAHLMEFVTKNEHSSTIFAQLKNK